MQGGQAVGIMITLAVYDTVRAPYTSPDSPSIPITVVVDGVDFASAVAQPTAATRKSALRAAVKGRVVAQLNVLAGAAEVPTADSTAALDAMADGDYT